MDVQSVQLYTAATDDNGRPVEGLTRAEFHVVEDGVLQTNYLLAKGALAIDADGRSTRRSRRVAEGRGEGVAATGTAEDRGGGGGAGGECRGVRCAVRGIHRLRQ